MSAVNRVNSQPSFHRRTLLAPAVSFSSADGRALFKESFSSGYLESYFQLSEQFTTQSHPSFCGLASLTMVLNALSLDPGRIWRGSWRWFDDSMLDCCDKLETIESHGITLPRVSCLARCNGAEVKMVLAERSDVDIFRKTVKDVTAGTVCASGKNSKSFVRLMSLRSILSTEAFMIVSYNRKKLNQTGSGHYSPIGGYHPLSDKVLIMDVARFKVFYRFYSYLHYLRFSVDAEVSSTLGAINDLIYSDARH